MKILKIKTLQRKIGDLGERAATLYLLLHGYLILKRNYTAHDAEIDIIAQRGNTTAFIEVKARNVKGMEQMNSRPAAAVNAEKQRKIIKASEHFMRQKKLKTRMRYDIIEVYLVGEADQIRVRDIKHLTNSFNLNTAYDANYYYRRKKEGSNL